MTKLKGQYAKVTMKVDSTTVAVAELREWSISTSTEKVDATVAGAAWTTHEVGHATWEGAATILDVDVYWVDHIFDKVDLEFFYHEDDAAPAYTGKASVDFDTTAPYDDMIETELTFTGDGALTKGA